MMLRDRVVDCLLAGGFAIRRQVHGDLIGSPSRVVANERARVARAGWDRRFLALQVPDGRWRATRLHPGKPHCELERPGEPSRWVVLLCRRAIRWWESGGGERGSSDSADVAGVVPVRNVEPQAKRKRLLSLCRSDRTNRAAMSSTTAK